METKYRKVPLQVKASDSPGEIDAIVQMYPELESVKDSIMGVVRGTASVFGNIDSYGDITAKGAFEETIKENGPSGKNRVKMLPLHKTDKFPIGRILELSESNVGLEFTSIVLATDGELGGKNAWLVIKSGAVTELSYGYNITKKKDTNIDGKLVTILEKVDLWEISPVIWGANDQTSFKSAGMEEITTLIEETRKSFKETIERITINMKKEKDKDISFKDFDATQSLDYMLRGKVIDSIGDDFIGNLCVNLIGLNEFVYNHWYYPDNEQDWFDNYYRQGYVVVNGAVELVGDRTQVQPARTFVDKKSKKEKEGNQESNEFLEKLKELKNSIKKGGKQK